MRTPVISYRSGSVPEDDVTGFIVNGEEDANRAVRDRSRLDRRVIRQEPWRGCGFCARHRRRTNCWRCDRRRCLVGIRFRSSYGYGYPGYGCHRGYAPAY